MRCIKFILQSFLAGSWVAGWSSLMVVVLIIGGLQMAMLGILGEYLWRTFDESRQRPQYVIESLLGLKRVKGAEKHAERTASDE